MSALRAALSELLGLFVDDGWLALAVLLWLVLCGFVLPRVGLPIGPAPLVLFAGLAGIVVASTVRAARRGR